jgi:imidazolonepropionase-like amidohydrolase
MNASNDSAETKLLEAAAGVLETLRGGLRSAGADRRGAGCRPRPNRRSRRGLLIGRVLCGLALAATAAPDAAATAQSAGQPGAVQWSSPKQRVTTKPNSAGPVLLRAAKILTCSDPRPDATPSWIDNGALLISGGLIQELGAAGSFEVPPETTVIDLGPLWLMPGMVDLHCHIAGRSLFEENDLNDTVYLANPELRVTSAVQPGRPELRTGLAGGVTSVLYIPGSGSNMGGQGVLLKTGLERYEEMHIRSPGSLKLAQAGNPERWTISPGRSFMNWNSRDTVERGLAYAKLWSSGVERGAGGRPDPRWDVFHGLLAKTVQISAHTQIPQVVLATITMWKRDLGIDVYLDHSEIGGWRVGKVAVQYGVPAIIGPRSIDTTSPVFQRITSAREPGIRGLAAEWQAQGQKAIGFNTDSPVVPQEELSVQATIALRHGFKDHNLDSVRGLTIEPAKAAGLDHLIGSLEPGKHADILAITGHPADPRTSIESVWIEGHHVYDPHRDGRRW